MQSQNNKMDFDSTSIADQIDKLVRGRFSEAHVSVTCKRYLVLKEIDRRCGWLGDWTSLRRAYDGT